MKENLNRAMIADLETCVEMKADRILCCCETEDHREAFRACTDMQRPTVDGR